MLTTEPPTCKATLHDRIENDRLSQPAHSPGAGTTRVAALIAAAKARGETGS